MSSWKHWGPLLGVIVLPLGCDRDAKQDRQHETGELGPVVQIASGSLTAGYALGTGRETLELPAFRVGRHPVTVKEYRACVSAGTCTPPGVAAKDGLRYVDRPTYGVEGSDALPVNCVTADQAQAYCAWASGRLPRASEWLMAARGAEVATFSWGNQDPTCERHPVARGLMARESSCCHRDESCDIKALLTVGSHPSGASPSGVEDVLIADGEYVTPDDRSSLTDCGGGACLISGRGGQIEAISSAEESTCAVTFRCAVSEG
jgi:Sulfatase-modifying factor enzyme 1